MVRRVLFLCTGNFYRSRFAEALFNHLARRRGLEWVADSAGLVENCWTHNRGKISTHTLDALKGLGVALPAEPRTPRDVSRQDLTSADRIVALNRKEHQPMLRERFADLEARVEYWDFADVGELGPVVCLAGIRRRVEVLVSELERV